MSRRKKKTGLRIAVITIEILIGVVVILGALKYRSSQEVGRGSVLEEKQPKPKQEGESIALERKKVQNIDIEPPKSVFEGSDELIKPESEVDSGEVSIDDIVNNAKGWGQKFLSWTGREMPDLTFKDLSGKEHKLSDYRGKDVVLIFWATWCQPCLSEIPGFIQLRNSIGEDKLAMLAVSNEHPELLKRFVVANQLNYTVLRISSDNIPIPYSIVNSIPITFFITAEGKLKIAAVGAMNLNDVKAILEAKAL